jgi:hypothetical protein
MGDAIEGGGPEAEGAEAGRVGRVVLDRVLRVFEDLLGKRVGVDDLLHRRGDAFAV